MIICPKCGKSHYNITYSTTTLKGWSPVFKDGKLINRDPNTTTDYVCCIECGESFAVERKPEEVLYEVQK